MIQDLKDFDKLLKICRKQGVTEVSFQGISLKFGDLPHKGGGELQEEASEDQFDPVFDAVRNI